MLQFIRSLLRIAPDDAAGKVDVALPPQNGIPAHDPFPSMLAEQVRQQEQWIEAVAASNAAQQAIDAAVHDPHR